MKDNFSRQADLYARYRPQYPASLFEYITGFVKNKNLAWDCGTGNGQSAIQLSKYFEEVYATDISQKQIDQAQSAKNITYVLEPAENTMLKNSSVGLVTISQALHWFEFDKFYDEVKRVCKPYAIIAAWTYSLLQIDDRADPLIEHYHYETLNGYWDNERKYVDDGYKSVPFPFRQIISPVFNIELNWGLEELEGYFNTWSALQKFIKANNYNPVPALMEQIKKSWHTAEIKKIIFPIHMKIGYVH